MKPQSIIFGFCILAFSFFPQGLTTPTIEGPSASPGQFNLLHGNQSLHTGAISFEDLPLRFEANRGQAEDQVKFLLRGSRHILYLTPAQAVLEFHPSKSSSPAILRMKLEGGNPSPQLIGEEELPGVSNYLIGNDPGRWRTKIPHYAKIRYADVYPGVDLVFYGDKRQLEFDFIVSPGAKPSSINLALEGAKKLKVEKRGDLAVDLGDCKIRLRRPHIYQGARNKTEEIGGKFVLSAENQVGFEVGPYDLDRPLTIDPTLAYSTFYGGSSGEGSSCVVEDVSGNIYFCGTINHPNLPTVNPLQPSYGGGLDDAFVGKLNSAGSALIYVTYLGGSDRDGAGHIAVDTSGNAYLIGNTASTNFPTVNPLQSSFGGTSIFMGDAFITKLNADGSALLYSTYLGGSADDVAQGIAVDGGGNAYVMGSTHSSNFPTASPFQANLKGYSDAFLAKLNSSGSALIYSTYLGGSDYEVSSFSPGKGDIAIDANGCAYVGGFTGSADFPTVNAFQATKGGGQDGFITKFNSTGYGIVYSTYLGGDGSDGIRSIAVAPNGMAGVTGTTRSTNFPTRNPFKTVLGGEQDAFVTVLTPDGSSLYFSSYLGGSANEVGNGIAFSPTGNVCIAGLTQSSDFFPIANAIQPFYGGGDYDAFVSMFSHDGSNLIFSTFLGGDDGDIAEAVGVNAAGNIYLGGGTVSSNFPTVNPLQASYGGGGDMFFARIQMEPTGPVPTLSSISPSSAAAGDPGFNLRVRGSDFLSGAVVNWDGSGRPTIYISSTELRASIGSADLAGGKVVQVTVSNPGGGLSGALPFSISNPVPTLSTISPTTAMAGGAEFVLTLTGSNFVPNSAVRWNSTEKTTTYVSGTELRATIPASDLTTGGDVQVTVRNPEPAGGTSGAMTFQVADFSVSASPVSVSVTAGQLATYQVSLAPAYGAYDSAVSLSCSGMPTACTSSFSQTSVTPGSTGATATLTLATKSSFTALVETLFGSTGYVLPKSDLGLLLLALFLLARKLPLPTRKGRSLFGWLRASGAVCLIILLMGCGGSSGRDGNDQPKTGTPAGSYTITIEGKVGSLTRSTTVTLVVK